MIVYSGSRLKATDGEGNTQSISVIDVTQDSLKTGDDVSRQLLYNIIKELKIMNYHMSLMTDSIITEREVISEMSEINK